MTGRPTKRTEDRIKTIVRALERGAIQETACYIAGISPRTLQRWLAEDEERGDDELEVRLRQAAAKPEESATESVVGAFKDDWRAGAWWLERRVKAYNLKIDQRVEGRVSIEEVARREAQRWLGSAGDVPEQEEGTSS